MHKEVGKLSISMTRRYEIVGEVLKREVKSFTALTEDEALAVWNACRREASQRPVSDGEAQALPN